jgi:hypothetical protein|tara:strand:+ start:224 stop:493 length:270 start_codon:yes stop_codon:yes gene_type:complete
MAAKGTAGKSASGASMSKYDMEVEERLQALEKQAHPMPTGATQKKVDDRLAALEAAIHTHDGGSTDASLEDKVAKITAWLENNTSFYGH